MEYTDIPFSRIEAEIFFEFLTNLRNTIDRLRNRDLKEETSPDGAISVLLDSSPDILTLINKGESETLEYKSSLRFDLVEKKTNLQLEKVVVKTIAAFANNCGGDLIIGISDNKDILGLENDYKTFSNGNRDKFEIYIRELIGKEIDIVFSINKIKINFHEISEKEICHVSVIQAEEPKFISECGKHGNMQEKFYVRSGNSSIPLSLKSSNEYIQKRFYSKNIQAP